MLTHGPQSSNACYQLLYYGHNSFYNLMKWLARRHSWALGAVLLAIFKKKNTIIYNIGINFRNFVL